MTDLLQEQTVLVNEQDQEVGMALKATLHTADTPLHRGFSLYLFTRQGEFLLQQRKKEKKTWGGFWSNSCCGHPGPGEGREQAIQRRTRQELGLSPKCVEKIADYRYRFEHNGVVENEVCPVFVGIAESKDLRLDKNEIEAVRWMPWSGFLKEIQECRDVYSPWSQEQAKILASSPRFHEWLSKHGIKLA